MKNSNIKLLALLFSITLWALMQLSCVDEIQFGDKFLEKDPGVDVTQDTIFTNPEYTRYFLWNLYQQVNSPFYDHRQLNSSMVETITDLIHAYSTWSWAYEVYYPGLNTEDTQNRGQDKFTFNNRNNHSLAITMRKGWLFIEKLPEVPDMTEEEKSQLRGETYIIMASVYLDYLKNFGGLPLIDFSYDVTDNYERGRATVEKTVEFIDSLIVCAINEPGFRWRWEDQQTWAGRISKSVAYALRANLWWFAASPLFNDVAPYMEYTKPPEGQPAPLNQDILHVWYGGYKPELWDKAREYCEEFFRLNQLNGNWYELIQPATQDEQGYCYAYRAGYWFRGNSEKILEVHTTYLMNAWGRQQVGIGNVTHQGHHNPTFEWMEMFGMQDGRKFPYNDVFGTNNPNNIDIMANRDPRLYESILVTREWLLDDYSNLRTVELWQGGNIVHNTTLNEWGAQMFPTGMALFKWILDFNKMAYMPHAFSYLRMADMHMMYAECLAETGELNAALDELHKVRSRVGLGRLEVMHPELNLSTNKENFIAELMRERACEFGAEDRRLYDQIRRKMEWSFTRPLHELVTWRKTAEGEKDLRVDTRWDRTIEPWPNFIYEKRQIAAGARRWWTPGYWTNKWYLSPLPRPEINKGYGLTQNPGW